MKKVQFYHRMLVGVDQFGQLQDSVAEGIQDIAGTLFYPFPFVIAPQGFNVTVIPEPGHGGPGRGTKVSIPAFTAIINGNLIRTLAPITVDLFTGFAPPAAGRTRTDMVEFRHIYIDDPTNVNLWFINLTTNLKQIESASPFKLDSFEDKILRGTEVANPAVPPVPSAEVGYIEACHVNIRGGLGYIEQSDITTAEVPPTLQLSMDPVTGHHHDGTPWSGGRIHHGDLLDINYGVNTSGHHDRLHDVASILDHTAPTGLGHVFHGSILSTGDGAWSGKAHDFPFIAGSLDALGTQHGVQPGGSLHALATPDPGGTAGFISGADLKKVRNPVSVSVLDYREFGPLSLPNSGSGTWNFTVNNGPAFVLSPYKKVFFELYLGVEHGATLSPTQTDITQVLCEMTLTWGTGSVPIFPVVNSGNVYGYQSYGERSDNVGIYLFDMVAHGFNPAVDTLSVVVTYIWSDLGTAGTGYLHAIKFRIVPFEAV